MFEIIALFRFKILKTQKNLVLTFRGTRTDIYDSKYYQGEFSESSIDRLFSPINSYFEYHLVFLFVLFDVHCSDFF